MNIIPYQLIRIAFLILALLSIPTTIYLLHRMRKKSEKWKRLHLIEIEAVFLIITLAIGLFAGVAYSGFPSSPQFVKTVGPGAGPHLPLLSSVHFFKNVNNFEKIDDISENPTAIPPPISRNTSEHLTIDIVAKEVLSEIIPGTTFNYWTFNDRVPAPFIRARVGDTITINLENHPSNIHTHSLDFHAVTGPGGGAEVLQVPPGETKTFTFKALNPGIYIYHCASMPSVAAHMTHGQYGLILIEPEEGLPPVDKEFYIVQGELYTMGSTGDKGLQAFDAQAMLDGNPTYIVFNGRVGGVQLEANVGDTIRMYVGNGGVNLISSFHVIGEIFDTVYPEGSMKGALFHNVQTTLVPAGGATIVEFKLEEPGTYILVDHALARVEKGAYGILNVQGEFNEEIYYPKPTEQ
ncbi:MAG: nitrite reductase, copper-containing [Candidatus Woesearchaeota archaeon]|nr:MAG: nitrite reductase, copper-containing [Candidatus Woesearchaeota archaeon]